MTSFANFDDKDEFVAHLRSLAPGAIAGRAYESDRCSLAIFAAGWCRIPFAEVGLSNLEYIDRASGVERADPLVEWQIAFIGRADGLCRERREDGAYDARDLTREDCMEIMEELA
jgi:hypothetical protein